LLDEPLAALDVHSRREVRAFLAEYLTRLGLPTLVVTHDGADARRLGDRIAVLEAGKLSQTGTWAELSSHPASRFVEELVASTADRGREEHPPVGGRVR
jgi:molybdate transport system ATP-binding protein